MRCRVQIATIYIPAMRDPSVVPFTITFRLPSGTRVRWFVVQPRGGNSFREIPVKETPVGRVCVVTVVEILPTLARAISEYPPSCSNSHETYPIPGNIKSVTHLAQH